MDSQRTAISRTQRTAISHTQRTAISHTQRTAISHTQRETQCNTEAVTEPQRHPGRQREEFYLSWNMVEAMAVVTSLG